MLNNPTSVYNQTLLNEATDLLLACLRGIPKDRIDPKMYWSWAQKALTLAGNGGTTFEKMVSIIHRELHYGDSPFSERSSERIYTIGESIKASGQFSQFRRLLREQAPYIVVMARVRRKNQKGSEK